MFSHLIESDSHKGDLKRKGSFFLMTMMAYALVLMAAGVAGVYAYEAQVDDQKLELVAMVPPDMPEPKQKEAAVPPRVGRAADSPAGTSRSNGGLIKNTPTNVSSDLTKIAGAAKSDTSQTPPIFSTTDRRFDPGDYSSFPGNGVNKDNRPGTGGDDDGRSLVNEGPPPRIIKKEEPPQKQRIQYVGPVNGKALNLPQPVYTPVAKAAGAQGPVTVEIVIDETGRVIQAHATGGHPLLKAESEKAAYRARFSPTLLQNQPVKVKGVITFNFILNR